MLWLISLHSHQESPSDFTQGTMPQIRAQWPILPWTELPHVCAMHGNCNLPTTQTDIPEIALSRCHLTNAGIPHSGSPITSILCANHCHLYLCVHLYQGKGMKKSFIWNMA